MRAFMFNWEMIPPDEEPVVRSIEHNLYQLQMAAEEFRASAKLYLFAHSMKLAQREDFPRDLMVSWMRGAGRNGAVVAGSFCRVAEAINSARCPRVKALWNAEAKNEATRLLQGEFPDIASVRNSAAHPGEFSKDADELERHTLTRDHVFEGLGALGAGSYVSDAMGVGDDRLVFHSSFKGRGVSYELSLAKADVLDLVAQLYRETFYPVEDPVSKRARDLDPMGSAGKRPPSFG